MTVNCEQIQTAILETFDYHGDLSREVMAHSAACQSCAAFARRHAELDAQLRSALVPPSTAPLLRARLQRDIRRDRLARRIEWLPDLTHLLACVAAISIYIRLTPDAAVETLVRGAIGALAVYAIVSIARSWLDESYS